MVLFVSFLLLFVLFLRKQCPRGGPSCASWFSGLLVGIFATGFDFQKPLFVPTVNLASSEEGSAEFGEPPKCGRGLLLSWGLV